MYSSYQDIHFNWAQNQTTYESDPEGSMKIKRILVLTINHYDNYLHAKLPYRIIPYPSQDANIFSGLIVEQVFTIYSLCLSLSLHLYFIKM